MEELRMTMIMLLMMRMMIMTSDDEWQLYLMTITTMMGIAPLPWSAQHQGQEPTHYEAMPEKVNIETIFPTLKTYST